MFPVTTTTCVMVTLLINVGHGVMTFIASTEMTFQKFYGHCNRNVAERISKKKICWKLC